MSKIVCVSVPFCDILYSGSLAKSGYVNVRVCNSQDIRWAGLAAD